MRGAARLKWALVLWVAGTSVGLAGANPESPNLRGTLTSPLDSGWVVADFNGDLRADFASTRLTSHDSRGYRQEVRISLGRSEQTTFAFSSRAAKIELNSWDVDGDADRDIVVLEALSRRPVGVWLNDGAGSFEEGDLESFAKSWGGNDVPVLRAELHCEAPFAIVEQRVQGTVPSVSIGASTSVAERLPPARHQVPQNSCGSHLRVRAPPRCS